MKNLLGPAAFGVTLAAVCALSSAQAIFMQGEFEAAWGANGTFHFALAIAAFVGLLGAAFFWLGSRRSRVSAPLTASLLLGFGVAVAFLASPHLIPLGLFGKLWLLPWILLCVLSALAPVVYRSMSVGRASGR